MFSKKWLSHFMWPLIAMLLALCGGILLWMTAGGQIGSPDEALHWTQPWRFAAGDIPFLHEWHPSVMCGVLLLPVLRIFQLVGLGEVGGFMLSMRHAFAVVWVSFVLVAAFRWWRINPFATIIGMLMVLVYPPWGECNFSYNAIGVLAMMVAIAFYAVNESGKRFDYFASGLFFALAVLCCPHLLLVYFCYSLYALRRERTSWALVTVGSAFIAVIFFVYIFSQMHFHQFFEVLPNVLHDPEHSSMSLLAILQKGIGRFLFITHEYAYGHAVILGTWVITIFVSVFDVGRKRRILYYSFAECTLAISLWLYYFIQPMVGNNPSYMVVPLLAGGIGLLIVEDDTVVRQIFFKAWLPVAGYAFVLSLSSNLGLYSSSFAFEAASIPAVIILFRFVQRQKAHSFVGLMIIALIIVQVTFSFRSVIRRVVSAQSTDCVELAEGPLSGARVSVHDADNYKILWEDTKDMRCDGNIKSVCFLDHRNQWLYLTTHKRSASFSSWMCGVNSNSIERLDRYWQLMPEKKADAIFLPKKHAEFANHFESRYGYYQEVKDSGNIILRRKVGQ